MRLLDRYLLRELLVPLAYCLSGFIIFGIAFDLFSELGHFQEEKFTWPEIARYYSIRTPEFIVLVLPIALLLALLYALTHHARHHELTAIRAAGVSLLRLTLPYLGVGLVLSLASFAINELWVPQASQTAEELFSRTRQASAAEGRWQPVSFRNARAERYWRIGAFNLDTGELRDVHVAWRLPDESQRSLIASNAVRTDGVWIFQDVQEFIHPAHAALASPPTHTNRLELPELSETPEQIRSEIKINQLTSLKAKAAKETQLSVAEILNYLALHPELSPDTRALLFTQLHGRLAAPWTALVMVLIAIPFGMAPARRNAFVGVAGSIFICFAYFVVFRLGLALGTGNYVAPWLAAWAPNILFATTGIALALRVR